MKYAESVGNRSSIAYYYEQMSLALSENCMQGEALEYLQKALEIFTALGKKLRIAVVLQNMGSAYMQLGNDTSAIAAFEKAIALYEELKYYQAMEKTFIGLATCYRRMNDLDKAYSSLQRSVAFLRQQFYHESNGRAYFMLAEIDSIRGDYKNAMIHYRKGQHIQDSIAAMDRESKLTAILQQHNLERLQDSMIAVQHAKDLSYAYEKKITEEQLRQQKQDLLLNQQTIRLKNMAIEKAESESEIALLQSNAAESERAKKEIELSVAATVIDNLQKDKALQEAGMINARNYSQILIGSLLIFFLFSGLVFYYRNQRRQLLLEKKITETELNVFRSQMNPHFMFNALNSIHAFILSNKTKVAATYLEKFSHLMRMILENSRNPVVTLADDLKALELYIELEQERLDNRFTHRISVDSALQADEVLVPPMIFQPFIENAIWHGLSHKPDAGIISLNIARQGDLLTCTITDNGTGMKPSNKSGKSYGIAITKQRIENLNKVHKSNAYCRVEEIRDGAVAAGVRVELGLPYLSEVA